MAEPDGLYGEAARTFFVRQQHRRHLEQLRADGRLAADGAQTAADEEELFVDRDDRPVDGVDPAIGAASTIEPTIRAETAPGALYQLRVVSDAGKDTTFALRDGPNRIGRDPGNDVILTEPTVSHAHAIIHVIEGLVHVEDVGSANGTTVEGEPVTDLTDVDEGHILSFGRLRLRLERVGRR